MCPDFAMSQHKQHGSALIISLFIIVVMTLLVAALSKLLISSTESVSYEVLGTRAFFAAQSGVEYGLAQLFPLTTATDPSGSSSYCAIATGQLDGAAAEQIVPLNTASGLQNCSFTLNCKSARPTLVSGETIYYQLVSTGTCGSGSLQTSRTVEIEVWQ